MGGPSRSPFVERDGAPRLLSAQPDSVHKPARSRFVDAPHYYGALFHELVHSTGHESRFNRTFGARFGGELYSKEELVTEIDAAFLCAIADIANDHIDHNTAAYIQNWISRLEEDNRLVVHAAANAQQVIPSSTTRSRRTERRWKTPRKPLSAAPHNFPIRPKGKLSQAKRI